MRAWEFITRSMPIMGETEVVTVKRACHNGVPKRAASEHATRVRQAVGSKSPRKATEPDGTSRQP
jgi:hypothetical protein